MPAGPKPSLFVLPLSSLGKPLFVGSRRNSRRKILLCHQNPRNLSWGGERQQGGRGGGGERSFVNVQAHKNMNNKYKKWGKGSDCNNNNDNNNSNDNEKCTTIVKVRVSFCFVLRVGQGWGSLRPRPPRPVRCRTLVPSLCHYYLTLAALPAGFHFNPSRAHPGTAGTPIFQRSVDFFPLPSSNRAAALLIRCDPLRKLLLLLERERRQMSP